MAVIAHDVTTVCVVCRLDKVSLTLWDTSSDEDVNINETAAKVLRTEDLAPKLPVVGVAGDRQPAVTCIGL